MPPKKRILVVGAGSIGERHVRCFLETERAEVSICETDDATRWSVASRYPVAASFAELEEALGTLHDAAVVATPAHLHVAQSIRLAGAGLHLLVEKPLSTSLAGIPELEAVAAEKRLAVAVAYVWRAHPGLESLKRSIEANTIGRPLQLVVTSGQHFPTYRPAYREIYYRDRARGGGAVQDALTHLINAGEFLIGAVERLVADASHQALPGVEVEDTAHVLTRQAGALASYAVNQFQAPNETTFTVVGEGGTLRFERHRGRVRSMALPDGEWSEVWAASVPRDEPFLRQAHAFLDQIDGTRPALCSLADGVATLKVNLAVLRSASDASWTATE